MRYFNFDRLINSAIDRTLFDLVHLVFIDIFNRFIFLIKILIFGICLTDLHYHKIDKYKQKH